jgi:carbonic anhydrase
LPYPQTPEASLARLREGNARFMFGQTAHPNRENKYALAQAVQQRPFAAIVGCSDGHLPAEVIFDQGPGDLFSIHITGPATEKAAVAALEYAANTLGVKTIVILGHENCKLLAGALSTSTPSPHENIYPGIQAFVGKPDQLEDAIKAYVLTETSALQQVSPDLHRLMRENRLHIVAAYYHAHNGRVTFL